MKVRFLILILILIQPGFAQETNNGDFESSSAFSVLKEGSNALINEIKQCPHDEFFERTLGVPKSSLLHTIAYDNIVISPTRDQRNFNLDTKLKERQHFTYDRKKRKIIALSRYFEDFKTSEGDAAVQSVKRKLAHEASHVWGKDQDDSKIFVNELFQHLQSDKHTPIENLPMVGAYESAYNRAKARVMSGQSGDFSFLKTIRNGSKCISNDRFMVTMQYTADEKRGIVMMSPGSFRDSDEGNWQFFCDTISGDCINDKRGGSFKKLRVLRIFASNSLGITDILKNGTVEIETFLSAQYTCN